MIVFRADQEDIMKYKGGKMAIQAVPGAGKTFIITHLVARLLEEMKSEGIDGKILILTYMNSAVSNFKTRIRALIADKDIAKTKFEVMTIHSLALAIIKDNSHLAFAGDDFFVIDDYKKAALIEESINEYRSDFILRKNFDPVRAFIKKGFENLPVNRYRNDTNADDWERRFKDLVASSIRMMKFECLDDRWMIDAVNDRIDLFNRLKKENDPSVQAHTGIFNMMVPIYNLYQQKLRDNGYMDYEDILLMAYNILKDNEDVRRYYQKKYAYIFEDECQDSNALQGKIIDLISVNSNVDSFDGFSQNLVRIGDVNQSITGTFAGSDPKLFMDFCSKADFYYNMDMSSRSSRDVIDLANYLVYLANVDKDNFVNKSKSEVYDMFADVTSSSSSNIDYGDALAPVFMNEVTKGKGYKENPRLDYYAIDAFPLPKEVKDFNQFKPVNMRILSDLIHNVKLKHPEYTIGVLTFFNSAAEDTSKYLSEHGIENELVGVDDGERKKIILDLKLCLDFLVNPDDRLYFKRLVRDVFVERFVEARKAEIFDELDDYFKNVDILKWIFDDEYYLSFKNNKLSEDVFTSGLSPTDVLKSITNLNVIRARIQNICMFSQIDLCDLVNNILGEIDTTGEERLLSKHLLVYVDNLVRYDNVSLNRLSMLLDYKYLRVFDSSIDCIYEFEEKELSPGSVCVSTLHKSKGLEWDVAIVSDVSQYAFPASVGEETRSKVIYLKDSYMYPEALIRSDLDYFVSKKSDYSKDESDNKFVRRDLCFYIDDMKKSIINERVRLLYVGITRAKKVLYLTCASNKRSRFFDDMKRFIDLKKCN